MSSARARSSQKHQGGSKLGRSEYETTLKAQAAMVEKLVAEIKTLKSNQKD